MGKSNSNASLGHKIKGLFGDFKRYWNKPPAGRYLSFKEATAYCVGGMGAVAATVIPTYVTLAAGNYIAAALKINVDHITLIGIITSIITILRAPLYSMIIDNTHTKYGKFRPYLIWMPIPIMLSFVAFAFLDMIPNYTAMLVIFTIIFNVMQFFMGLYSLAFTTLIQVISPKQSEKEWLMGIGSFAYSLGPSIVNAALPLIANFLFTQNANTDNAIQGINTMGPYRWLVQVFLLVCFAVGYLVAFGTKERIVQPKSRKAKVSFVQGVKSTSMNKYFWLNTSSNILGVFKLVGTTYTTWLCIHVINNEWALSLFSTILSTAYTPGMLLAPILIKKFGKKNLTIFSNSACVILTIPIILACIKPAAFTPYLIIALSYFIILANSIQTVITPALTTQIYDYQQYKTGERHEGFISQFGAIIGTLFGIATAFVFPAIYKHFGYVDDATVLKQANVIYPIIMTTCIIAIGSGILSIIPYFFWDLSEKRHMCLIEVLKVRALREDGQLDEVVAENIIKDIEDGNENALNEYILAHPLEDSEDFISVKGSDVNETTCDDVTTDAQSNEANDTCADDITIDEVEDIKKQDIVDNSNKTTDVNANDVASEDTEVVDDNQDTKEQDIDNIDDNQ